MLCAASLCPVIASAIESDPAPSQKLNGTEPSFRPDTESDAHRIIMAASFLLLLGIGSASTVYFARRGGLGRLKIAVDPSPMRIISTRRVTSRLTLVKIQLDEKRTVVIADNGAHLLQIDIDEPETRPDA